MSSSETEAQTLVSLAGSRDIPRVLRLVSELCKTLSSHGLFTHRRSDWSAQRPGMNRSVSFLPSRLPGPTQPKIHRSIWPQPTSPLRSLPASPRQ